MQIITCVQGDKDWYAARAKAFTASETPAAMGASKFKSRSELLREKATGLVKEVDAGTQRRFDSGHAAESAARGIVEEILGTELYPCVGTLEIEGLSLLASFDGLNMSGDIVWETKLWNKDLVEAIARGDIDAHYWAQIECQLLVSGADKAYFTASDGTKENTVGIWYVSQPERRQQIIAAWTQFAIDLENYQHVEHIEKPRAEVCIELPALFVHAKGEITTHNMQEFGEALQAKLVEVRAIALVTDQDFSNAKAAAKMFREKAKEIRLAKEAMLSQTVTIGEAARMMDAWDKDLNSTALQLEKDVEREDLAKKRVMVGEAGIAFSAHVEALEAETRPIQLNVQRPNFAEAIKGKRNYTSMQDALDTALAQGKIEADAIAKDLRHKLANMATVSEYAFLFPDLQQFIFKPADDFTLIVASRIAKHEAEAAAKLEAERARMQAQEEAKAKAAQDALLAAERAKMEAEVRANAEAEVIRLRSIEAAEIHTRNVINPPSKNGDPNARIKADLEAAAIEERRKQAQLDAQAQPFKLSGAKTVVAQAITTRPSDKDIIAAISEKFGVSTGKACDWIFEVAEAMRQAA